MVAEAAMQRLKIFEVKTKMHTNDYYIAWLSTVGTPTLFFGCDLESK